MTFEEWKEKYKPIESPYGEGIFFEISGNEFEFVRKCIHQITVEHYGLYKPDTLGIFIGRQTRNG